MTEKLYYENDLISEAQAKVLEVRPHETGFAVRLDKTLFFPESGGQLADKGKLNDELLIHVMEEQGEIWHIIGHELGLGETVKLALDVPSRIDHSQQHTGEHILSGLAHSMFGASNVGFHMADTYSTIDLDLFLDEEQLAELERAANLAVQSNVETTYKYVVTDELEGLELRKKAKGLSGEIRIVYAGGVDSCTCCGTHCLKSGDVGVIHINASMKYKGGVRLWFLCGMRAVNNAIFNCVSLEKLAKRFSVKPETVVEAVVKQGEELNKAKHDLKEKIAKLMTYRAAEINSSATEVKGKRVAVVLENDCTMQELKLLADKLCSAENFIAVIVSANQDVVQYALKRSENVNLDMREVCGTLNVMLGGKGGGRSDYAQGSAKARSDVDIAMEQFKTYMLVMLRA